MIDNVEARRSLAKKSPALERDVDQGQKVIGRGASKLDRSTVYILIFILIYIQPIEQYKDNINMPFLPPSQKSREPTENEEPISTTTSPPSNTNKLKDFEAVFPKLVKDLEDNAKQYNIPEDALKWYSNVSSLNLSQLSLSIRIL